MWNYCHLSGSWWHHGGTVVLLTPLLTAPVLILTPSVLNCSCQVNTCVIPIQILENARRGTCYCYRIPQVYPELKGFSSQHPLVDIKWCAFVWSVDATRGQNYTSWNPCSVHALHTLFLYGDMTPMWTKSQMPGTMYFRRFAEILARQTTMIFNLEFCRTRD